MEFSESVDAKQSSWRTTNFVPRNCHYFIIGSVLVALILSVISITLVITEIRNSKNSQKDDNVELQNKSNTYFVTYDNASVDTLVELSGKLALLINGTDLAALNWRSQKLYLLRREPFGSTILSFDVQVTDGEYIYWSRKVFDVSDEKYVVERYTWIRGDPPGPIGYANFTVESKERKPRDLVVDRNTGNLYTIDEDAVVLTSVLGPNYITLMADLVKPYKTVLDPDEGLMFVLQLSHSIVRANMDGSQFTEIVNNNITTLDIDTNNKRLYWVSNNFSIESSDYEGRDQRSLFVDVAKIETLALIDDRLFWTWPSIGNTTMLFSCEIDNSCVEHTTYHVPGNVTSIRGYNSVESKISSSCGFGDNAGCEHLYLTSGRDEVSCACRDGWQLSSDGRSCYMLL